MAKGWLDNYNDSSVSAPEGFQGEGYSTKGRNYSPAWGGQFQMGGFVYPVNYVPQAQGGMSVPGLVGFSYARTINPAPDNGPGAKKTKASAQNGEEMRYYQNGLDWKPKSISQNGGKKFKLKDEREENLIKRDEIPNIKPIKIGKPLTAKQKEERRVQELINKQGTITASKPQSIASKAWEVATHPMTALGYAVRNESLPENFSRGPINAHEMAVDVINPAFYTNQGIKALRNTGSAINNVSEGKLPAAYRDIKNAGMNALSVAPVVGEFGPEIKTLVNEGTDLVKKIPYGETAIPYAWKSRAAELGQIESQAMFDAIKQSNKLTEADKVLLAEYQYNSRPFTGRGGMADAGKKEALQKIIDKVAPEFQNNTVLTRRFNSNNPELFNLENGIINIGDRPTSFSTGIGIGEYNNAPDRIVLSGRNAKAIESNFLKNPYEELEPETLENLGNFSDITHPGFTGKTKYFTNDAGEIVDKIEPLVENKGFINNLNQTAVEKELIGSGFDFKQLGKVKNELGGYDYIVKPTNIQTKTSSQLSTPLLEPLPIIPRNNIIQSSLIDSELPKELEPYISRIGEPSISREEEVFRNVMGPQYREAKELENTKFFDPQGNIIPNPNTSQQQFYYGETPITDRPIQKDGGIIKDDMGYWNPENWNSPVEIGSNEITMKDVPFDVLGISDEGDVQHMKSNNPKNYKFKGKKVTEFRMAKNGLRQEQKGLVNLDQLTNFTNYNTKQPGGWLDNYN